MTMVSWLRTKKVVRKLVHKRSLFFKARITRITRNPSSAFLKPSACLDDTDSSSLLKIRVIASVGTTTETQGHENPCNPCNPSLKNKKHQLKTKLNYYEQQRKQQQKHVEQDSPRSDNDFNRHRHHLRGDIVHGAIKIKKEHQTDAPPLCRK